MGEAYKGCRHYSGVEAHWLGRREIFNEVVSFCSVSSIPIVVFAAHGAVETGLVTDRKSVV